MNKKIEKFFYHLLFYLNDSWYFWLCLCLFLLLVSYLCLLTMFFILLIYLLYKILKYLTDNKYICKTVWIDKRTSLLFENGEFSFSKHRFFHSNKFWKVVAQLVFHCPLLPNPQNSSTGKWPMTQKFLATPLSWRYPNQSEF